MGDTKDDTNPTDSSSPDVRSPGHAGAGRLIGSERSKLCALAWAGCIMNYMMRANLSVAVVCMTSGGGPSGANATRNSSDPYLTLNEAEFTWSRLMRGWILGSFAIGYFTCQVPFGLLTHKVGARRLMFLGISQMTLLTFLTPVAIRASPYAMLMVQAGKGISCSVFYTSIMYIWSQWVPPVERSRFNSFYSSGSLWGIVISFPLSGYLCKHGFAGGWPSIFYVPGMVGVVWLFGWWYFAYDNPDKHPRISAHEKSFIKLSLQHEELKPPPVPWRALLLSPPLIAIFVAEIAYGWGWYTLMTSLPQFMHDAFHFDIEKNALLSALPYAVSWLVSVMYSHLADRLIEVNRWKVVHVRQMSYAISILIPGILLVVVGYMPVGQVTWAVVIMTLALGVLGLDRSAHYVNLLDIAPRYASVTMGFINSNVFAMVAPIVNGALVPNGSRAEWQRVFLVNAGLQIGGVLFYCAFAQGEVQPWARGTAAAKETTRKLVAEADKEELRTGSAV